jgi:hypothetical protein
MRLLVRKLAILGFGMRFLAFNRLILNRLVLASLAVGVFFRGLSLSSFCRVSLCCVVQVISLSTAA